ncbi:MAG: Sensor histidine kinase RcsC [Gemmatimonadaceae bacterium]|nr:Sensor histidine kinase RcsC [Gemmatimonadaceae bacterium]
MVNPASGVRGGLGPRTPEATTARLSADTDARPWIGVVAGIWTAQFVALLLLPQRSPFRFVADCVGWVSLGVLCAILSGRRARREPGAATGWWLVSAAGWMIASVSTVDAVLWIVYGRLPLSPIVIAFMDNATWCLLLGGLLAWTGRAGSASATVRAALDATLLAASFFLIAWWIQGAELAAIPEVSFGRVVRSAIPFALTCAGLGIVAFLSARSSDRLRGPLTWFGIGYLLFLAGALGYASASMRGVFYPGHPLDAVSQLPLFAFAIAPMSQYPLPPPIAADDAGNARGDTLTNLPAIVALVIAAAMTMTGVPLDTLSRVVCVDVVALLLARQILAIRDVRLLSRTLEDRVRERTKALAESQMALARAQRIEAIGRLAGGIAHDFNNYLSAISGHAELLKDEFDPGHPAHESTEAIRESARSGGELARRLLSFAKPAANAPRRITAQEALARASQFTRGLARGRVQVEIVAPDVDSAVFMDPVMLDQVLTNLLTNAIDATTGAGTVRLAAERVSIGSRPGDKGLAAGQYLKFSVIDAGTGMDEATLAMIFDPFFTTKGGDRGTGLGLPTAYSIVTQVGGTISVQSKQGEGSRFEVFLREAVDVEVPLDVVPGDACPADSSLPSDRTLRDAAPGPRAR